MLKKLMACAVMAASAAQGETIVLSTDGTSTGDQLEGIGNSFTTVAVAEIADLTMTAKTATAGHVLNANAGDFGINSDIAGETADAFDAGEEMIFHFNKNVQITALDFGLFDDGDQFNVTIGSDLHSITWNELDNKNSDFIDGLNWEVSAETDVSFAAANAGDGCIGLDTMDVTVIPEPAALSLLTLTAVLALQRRRRKVPTVD